MAGLYNGHLEFPRIRVDSFTPHPPPHRSPWMLADPRGPENPSTRAPNAQYYLLTHAHSDHLIGLTNDFTGNIICSPDTKRMLLRLETEKDRDHLHNGVREVKRRKYESLEARHKTIETLQPGETKVVYIPDAVSITLLDANHCPGSSMFLVQNSTNAILHTGDVRADITFRKTLRRTPQLQAFFSPSTTPSSSSTLSATRHLDRIYLDTSTFMGSGDMPEKVNTTSELTNKKEPVLEALMTQMSIYPEDTVFFINAWCFGWEDIVKEVARHFNQPIHADRYKRSIYGAVESDPFLLGCTTNDPTITRFHVCDRYNRCQMAKQKNVVQVVMAEVKSASWQLRHQQFLNTLNSAALGETPWPMIIEVPFARHSPLPELQKLVKMFKPAALSPNTLIPHHNGMDFMVFADLLKPAISNDTYIKMIAERDQYFTASARFGSAWLSSARAVLSQLSTLLKTGSPDVMALPPYLTEGIGDQPSDNRNVSGLDQLLRVSGSRMEGTQAALPFTFHAPLPLIKATKFKSVSAFEHIPTTTKIVESMIPGSPDAASLTLTQTPHETSKLSQSVKWEPLHTTTPGPSQDLPSHRSQRLKRERRQTSYRVNIAHLSGLVGSQ
ncbi:hypothetical protein CcaverHIS631_0103910 [Cutaneotrichosporon cavernicola]|nr:hypothetical protein CcaverHIS631_0103910 [Cutaneotrichosporon cavernicola]BEJ03216.1 hypothetical protein CcaverHIS641_0103910 [Cutaneotrichosporon cavernicola]